MVVVSIQNNLGTDSFIDSTGQNFTAGQEREINPKLYDSIAEGIQGSDTNFITNVTNGNYTVKLDGTSLTPEEALRYLSSFDSIIIQEEGSIETVSSVGLNFTGDLVDVTYNNTTGITDVDISVGGIANTRITIYADQLDSAYSSDWAVFNNAPASTDPDNRGFVIRRFDDDEEEGVGWFYTIPANATNLTLGLKARRLATSGSAEDVILNLYRRQLPDNASVTSWSSALQLNTINMPDNLNFQYFQQTLSLATLGLTAGNLVQFQLTRNGVSGSDTLTGDWALIEVFVEPS